jgi:hypothetical protein
VKLFTVLMIQIIAARPVCDYSNGQKVCRLHWNVLLADNC